MTASDWGPDSPAKTRFRAFYDWPAPVEFEAELPDDIDGPDDERDFLLDAAPFAKQRAVRVEAAVPASTVAQGATNPPNPPASAIASGNDGSGDLSPETVASLVALARVIDPDACDPPAKSLPIGEAAEVWRRQDAALLTAKAVWEAGYRPPLSSVEAVAEADRLESIPANQELAAAIRVAMAGWQQSSEPAGSGVTDAFVYMANELIAQGFRLVSDDDATVDRVAAAMFDDYNTWVTWGQAYEGDRERFRDFARSAVRALREAGQ